MMLAVQVLESLAGDVRVYLGCGEIAVAQQHLYDAQVSTAIQQVRRESMSQAVR